MAQLSVHNVSISIEFVRSALLKLALERAEIDTLLVQCRIAPSLLNSPQARLSLTQFGQVITQLTLRSGDELLGYGKQPVPLGSLSLLMHWLLAASSPRQVLQRLCDFYRILGKGVEIEWVEDEEGVHLNFGYASHDQASQVYICEYGFFFVHRVLCWLMKEIFPIKQLLFPFSPPAYSRDYRLMFYGAPMAFNGSAARISFSADLLKRDIMQSREALPALLKDPFNQLLMLNFSQETWTSRVAGCVQSQLDDLPTLPQLAAQLQIAPHTLQRRLAAEGSSYLAIKNQIKRDSAIELLVNSKLSIEQISERLGFSETSPFTRTFKEWTGVPPSAYRKHH